MQTLTKTQQSTLDYIRAYIRKNGLAPTTQEIASGMGWLSPNSAFEHLQALQRKGYLKIKRGISRGIVLTDRNTVNIPDVADAEYWFDGLFQHERYERDVYKAIEEAGLKGRKKTWGGHEQRI